MNQMTRQMQVVLGGLLMVVGPLWSSVANFMTGFSGMYVVGAWFFGSGVSLVLFGPRYLTLIGAGAACAALTYGLLSAMGDSA
ncbi:MAG: hypothetical protein AAFV09_04885 [Pseudomonadota bacterium]